MKTNHTPGPWTFHEDGFIYDKEVVIASPYCTKEIDIDEREANGLLIAAAPHMLSVLIYAVEHAHVYDTNPALKELFEAVIKKATQRPERN